MHFSLSAAVVSSILFLAATSAQQTQQVVQAVPRPVADIPLLGFGTWRLDRSNASDAVLAAFEAGYRHFDCAAMYGNEKEVGDGIRRATKKLDLKREDFWVTSKLWNDHHDPSTVKDAITKTLSDLQIPYLDLYHMHWPVASDKKGSSYNISYIDTWRAMTTLLTTAEKDSQPLTRHIGVANFSPSQLKSIIPIHKPYLHQFESHPYLPQTEFISFHLKHDVKVTAYSPLANTNPTYGSDPVVPLLQNKLVKHIAQKQHCTPAQVALAWGMRRGTSVIPKSQHRNRIEENWASLQCKLVDEDFKTLALHMPVKRFNDPSKGWAVKLFGGLQDSMEFSIVRWIGETLRKEWSDWREAVDDLVWESVYWTHEQEEKKAADGDL